MTRHVSGGTKFEQVLALGLRLGFFKSMQQFSGVYKIYILKCKGLPQSVLECLKMVLLLYDSDRMKQAC